jgi:hypothetical protein
LHGVSLSIAPQYQLLTLRRGEAADYAVRERSPRRTTESPRHRTSRPSIASGNSGGSVETRFTEQNDGLLKVSKFSCMLIALPESVRKLIERDVAISIMKRYRCD